MLARAQWFSHNASRFAPRCNCEYGWPCDPRLPACLMGANIANKEQSLHYEDQPFFAIIGPHPEEPYSMNIETMSLFRCPWLRLLVGATSTMMPQVTASALPVAYHFHNGVQWLPPTNPLTY